MRSAQGTAVTRVGDAIGAGHGAMSQGYTMRSAQGTAVIWLGDAIGAGRNKVTQCQLISPRLV